MKVVSMFFLLFLFFVTAMPRLAYAKKKIVSSTNTEKNCWAILDTKPGLLDDRINCGGNESNGDAVNTSIGHSDEGYDVYVGKTTTDGRRFVSIIKHKSTNGLPADKISEEEIINNVGSHYALQLVDSSNGALKDNASSAAPLDRLFTAGIKNTAGANDYLSFALNAEGHSTGAKSTIFANPNNKFALGGTMSRDGGIAVQLSATSALWQLSTRLLNNGVPRKTPSNWTVPAYTGYSPDITNTIEVNSGVAGAPALKIRYLVYRAFRGVGTAAQQSQIMIQRIDDATGKPLEAAKPLTPFKNAFLAPAEAFQALAIAPNGDLLVFTEYSGACKKMILKAVKLVNGSVSGTAKLIAGCAGLAQSPFGYLGLDIMEEPESESP